MAVARRFARLLTPRGVGAVAVVECVGPRGAAFVASTLRRHAADSASIDVPPAGMPALRWLVVEGEVIDQVVVVRRADGRVELHLHGAPAVLAALEGAVGGFDEPDDVGPIERLLRTARGEAQLRLALEQRELEASGCGVDRTCAPDVAEHRASIRRRRAGLLRRSRIAVAVAEPVRLVLCGAQNAGKSTLMNRLLLDDRALTGAMPGLTRDPVRETTVLGGYPYELVDTAGEGPIRNDLDRAALAAARDERSTGFRLLVVDVTKGVTASDRALATPRTLWVAHKVDRPHDPWPHDVGPVVQVSSDDPVGAPRVRAVIGDALRRLRGLPTAGPVGGPAVVTSADLRALRTLRAARGSA